MKLTDVAIRQAKAKDKQYKLTDGTGLYLLVGSSGKYWRYDYRFDGKRKTLSYGVYPVVTLSGAREAHLEAKKLIQRGVDPMAARGEDKRSALSSFQRVAEQWRNHWRVGKTTKHDVEVWRRLELDVFPSIGNVLVSELTAAQVRDCIKAIEKRGALDIAKRQLQKCNQIMRYAVAHDLAERNPVLDVRPSDILPARKKRNYARIDAKDLPVLLHDIDNYIGSEHTRLALQFMALTFVRTSELIGAKWEELEIDLSRWVIPAERMKMRTPHIVPLSRQALAILEKLKSIAFGRDFLFPSDTDKPTHMSNNTILYALYRMGYRGRMTGHGFRGVASTILHEQGWPHEHIELQLAHQDRDETSAAYNHALYLPQRKKMMQAWADYLDAARGSRVAQIRSAG